MLKDCRYFGSRVISGVMGRNSHYQAPSRGKIVVAKTCDADRSGIQSEVLPRFMRLNLVMSIGIQFPVFVKQHIR